MAVPKMSLEEEAEERTAREHIEEIMKKLREVQEVDLAFLLDATGSMGTLIKAVRTKIVDIAEGLKRAFPEDGKLRFACAFYRDYDADESSSPRYQRSGICCEFTHDVTVFQKKMEGLEAWGGDDAPEDVFSGLERLLELEWTAPATRLVYHIADAPCHGRRFHDLQYAKEHEERAFKRERFKSIGATVEDDPEGRKIEDILMRLAVTKRISCYTFLHIHTKSKQRPTTAKMLEEFRKANDNNPSSMMQMAELTVERPGPGPGGGAAMASLSRVVGDAVRKTVNSSMNDFVNKPVVANDTIYEEIHVDDQMPSDWATLTVRPVFYHHSARYKTVDDMLAQIEQGAPLGLLRNKGDPIHVLIAKHPFTSACATRWPFYAKIQDVQVRSSTSDPTKLIVIKKFKSDDPRFPKSYENPLQHPYLEVMETYAIASQFAEEFNAEIKNTPPLSGCAPKMLYRDLALSTCKVAGTTECFTVETLHSNAQWIKVHETPDYYETLQAFSHWTHVRSGEFLMVIIHTLILERGTDNKPPRAVLCDPSIHSKKYPRRFKRTNKGEIGIQYFYGNHKCNNLCKVLGLETSE